MRDRFAPYALRARDLHAARILFGFFLQAFSALASFCARVNDFGLTTRLDEGWTTLPAPEKVALAGDPNIAGCGFGAALQPSPDSQGGGETG